MVEEVENVNVSTGCLSTSRSNDIVVMVWKTI